MYEAQLAKDWQYIIEDSGARLVLVGPESIYEKVKGFVGTVRRNIHHVQVALDTL